MKLADGIRFGKTAIDGLTKRTKDVARTINQGVRTVRAKQGGMSDTVTTAIKTVAQKVEQGAEDVASLPSLNTTASKKRITERAKAGVLAVADSMERAADAVGAGVGGAVAGGVGAVGDTIDGLVVTESDIAKAREELERYGETLQRQGERQAKAIQSAVKGRRKKDLLDRLVIGGVTLGVILNDPAQTPANIEEAFRHAYPDLAVNETFAEVVGRLPSGDLVGLVSGVKGKLFELEFADHLNSGNLPDGYVASIAESATQSGWDLKITGADGVVADLLQAKATNSVGYVQEALTRYPDIDVTTTSEVYAQLLALGMTENVINSGIALEALEVAVTDTATSVDSVFSASDLVPSTLGLAIIALTVYMDKTMSAKQKGAAMGERSAKIGVASGAGAAVMVVTQLWVLALLAGVGTSVLAGKGSRKRERLQILEDALAKLRGMKRLCAPTGKSSLRLAGI